MQLSNNDSRSGTQSIDWVTFSIMVSLIAIGWMMIYAVGYNEESKLDLAGFMKSTTGKQSIFIFVSVIIYGIVMVTDWKFWRVFAYAIYGIGILLLIGVLIFGTKVNGARAWFSFGGFLLQPAEFVKFGTCLAISSYLSSYSVNLKNNINKVYAVGLVMLPFLLINLQPDFGSSLVYLSFFILFYREGFAETPYLLALMFVALFIFSLIFLPIYVIIVMANIAALIVLYNFKASSIQKYLLFVLVLIAQYLLIIYNYTNYALILILIYNAILGVISYFKGSKRIVTIIYIGFIVGSILSYSSNFVFNNILEPHQQDRINVWLQPEKCDPRGSLYNLLQAKMAIGSGGLVGKGFLQGNMTKLNYVPEQNTDFIFCTIGEEQGFLGTSAVIILYVALLLRIQFLAERQRSNFSKNYAYGVLGILFLHFFFNIGMTMGLLPVVGIPLPFISYGGSSLLGFTLLISVLLKLDSFRYNV